MIKKILVIDDDTGLQDLLERLLSKRGFTIECCREGQTALSHILRFRPDLVLVDLDLPGMNGIEISRLMRSHPETFHILILMMTGYTQSYCREKALSSGITNFIYKPFALDELEQSIRNASLWPLRQAV